jgi:signal transduction histidine kinase/DNA-binding response OmpR family regulator
MWQALRGPIRATPEVAEAATELLLSTTRRLILTMGAAYLVWHLIATLTWPGRMGWDAWGIAAAVVGVTAASYLLVPARASLGVLLWLGGFALCVTLAIGVYGIPELALLYALLPAAATALLGWRAGVAAEAGVGLALWGITQLPQIAPIQPGVQAAILVTGALGGLLGWALEDTLLTVTNWSLASYAHAHENMSDARQRRGQLARALKDLDQAYYRLGRANAALLAAWKAADDAERFRSEFVANVSHELRTPLNLITGFSEMMMTAPESYGGVTLPGAYRSDLNAIYQSARHLLGLVDDVLDLARIEAGKIALAREEVDLSVLISEAVGIVRNYIAAKGLELQIVVAPDLPRLWVDRLRIRQVLLNLLVNAARFSDEGWIRVEAALDDEEVVVRVSDTGRGIPEQDLPKIFEPFRTTDQPASTWHSGTGLGLPISKKFVELHRGRMGVESTHLRGTTFWFTLPALAPAAVEPAGPVTARVVPAPSAAERAVVVVHDDPHIVTLLRRYLHGFWVVGAETWEEGLALAEEARAVAIITEPSRPIPESTGSIPVVACGLPSGRRAASAIGADDLLVKPVSHQELAQAIERLGRPVRSVLIADDDPHVVRLFERMLRTSIPGRECREAYNGEEALAMMRAQAPDLVLLDLAMPKVDGRGVLEQMAAEPALSSVPVIIISAKVQDYDLITLPGSLHVERREGFQLGEMIRVVGAVLEAISPGWARASARGPELQEDPVATPA